MINQVKLNPFSIVKIDPINLLQLIPLVSKIDFTVEDLRFFNEFLVLQTVHKGNKLLTAGETETSFRFLLKGLLRFYYINEEGHEISTHFVQKNEIACSFGSYTSGQPSVYHIEALEHSTLLLVKKPDMDRIMHHNGRFWEFANLLLTELYQQKETREREMLNNDALGRLQHFFDTTPQLFLKLPQIYIASYLKIRPETLSHLKRKLVFGKSSK